MTEDENTNALEVKLPEQPTSQQPEDTRMENVEADVRGRQGEELSKLTEKDLKDKINFLRQKVEQRERELKSIFREISLHNQGSDELKAKRDGLNARVKELSSKAAELKKKRDEANARIAELKSTRDQLRDKGRKHGEKIDDLKKIRTELNTAARGRLETLDRAYTEELDVFLTADIPLEHEINVFKRLIDLGQRLDATKKANEVHAEIENEYNKVKEIYTDMDSIREQIQSLANESQKYHEEMMAIYDEIDSVRKEADSYHAQLTEKYKGIAPLRKKIGALKTEIPKLRDELGIYLEKMKDLQLEKDEKKKEGMREQAKEKFQKSGRITLEEFRMLVENEDIKL